MNPLLINSPGDLFIGRYPEKSIYKPDADVTELLDQGYGTEFSLTMESGPEMDIWLQGKDVFGRVVSEVMPADEAAARLQSEGPWKSMGYSMGTANTLRFVMQVNPYVKEVQTIREFPGAFSKTALASLPTYLRAGVPPDPALDSKGKVKPARGKSP